jgi:glutathione S-transferase
MILTESNVINQYLVDHYDKSHIFATSTEQDKYLVDKYLGFQSSTQGPFYAQVCNYFFFLNIITMGRIN